MESFEAAEAIVDSMQYVGTCLADSVQTSTIFQEYVIHHSQMVMNLLTEHNLLLFLLQFGLILTLSKLVGSLFIKMKQPTITGDLLIGLILGPTILGGIFPEVFQWIFPRNLSVIDDVVQLSMLDTISWIGIMFLMLQAGMEINIDSVWKQKHQALVISLTDIFIPMLIAFVPVFLLQEKYLVPVIGLDTVPFVNRLLFSLFISSIMTISALPISIRVMQDLKILKTDLGVLIVSALTINDIVGWLFFTIILGIFSRIQTGASGTSIWFIVQIFSYTVAFTMIALLYGKKVTNKVIEALHKKTENPNSAVVTFICLLGLCFGIITLWIGIHGLFGFFVAGLVIGQSGLIKEKDRVFFDNFVHSIFVPLFFVNIGLKLDFVKNFDLYLVCLITFLGFFGRFAGAWIGSKMMRKNNQDSMAIGFAHTPGGEMHIVVGILALSSGLITDAVFVAIVLGAIITSILLGPTLTLTYKLSKKHNFKNLFTLNHIFLNTDFDTKEDVLRFLCIHASQELRYDIEYLLNEVTEREQVLSSGLGNHLAIPHARLDTLNKPVIYFLRNKRGIEWDAPDGISVDNIFMVLTSANDNTQQLQILSDIAKLFSESDTDDYFFAVKTEAELLKYIKEKLD